MEKMIDLLPAFLQDYVEIQSICNAEQPEFNAYKECYSQAEKDIIITTASEQRIYDYEKALDLIPAQTLSMKQRKERVISYLTNPDNYALQEVLRYLEESSLTHSVSYRLRMSGYEFGVECDIPLALWDVVSRKLRELVPANMILTLTNSASLELDGTVWSAGIAVNHSYRRIG